MSCVLTRTGLLQTLHVMLFHITVGFFAPLPPYLALIA